MDLYFNLPPKDVCCQLRNLFESKQVKDLANVFPLIIANIFGLDGTKGWDLRKICIDSVSPEITSFLSPDGALFTLCNKLSFNQQLRFDFSCNYLSVLVQNQLTNPTNDVLYAFKLRFDTRAGVHSLSLNALEYYLFHFAYHLVNPLIVVPEYDFSNMTVYTHLVIVYLQHFLPLSLLPSRERIASPYSDQRTMMETYDLAESESSCSNTSFGFKIFRDDVQLNHNNVFPTFLTHSKPTPQTWYSELIVRVFMDFWLITESDSKQNRLVQTLFYNQTVSACNEHLRCIQVFLEHLHSFSYYYVVGDNSPVNKFRKETVSKYRVTIYRFFRYAVKHYSLNVSFHFLASAWLSYIQPWRQNRRREMAQLDTIDCLPFIAENLLTYTNIYYAFVSRLSIADFMNSVSVSILLNITKVFAQLSSSGLINEIESRLTENQDSKVNNWRFFIKQGIQLMEHGDYVYSEFNSNERLKLMLGLAQKICTAIASLKGDTQFDNYAADRSSNWLEEQFSSFTTDRRSTNLRIVNDLTSCLENLQTIHRVRISEEELEDLADRLGMSDSRNIPLLRNNTSCLSANCTFDETTNLLLKQLSSVTYDNDPDTMSPRSWEIGFLVNTFNEFSRIINTKYARKMSDLYNQQTLLGRVTRQILEPPVRIRGRRKDKRYGPYDRDVCLSPRISLRRFANIYTVAGLVFWFILFACFGVGIIKIMLFFLALYSMYIVIMSLVNPAPIVNIIEQDK